MATYGILWWPVILLAQAFGTTVHGVNISLVANGTTQTFSYNQSAYPAGESIILIRTEDPYTSFVEVEVNTTANVTQQVCKDGNIRFYSGDNSTNLLYLGAFCGLPTRRRTQNFASSQNAMTIVIENGTAILTDNILTLDYNQAHNRFCAYHIAFLAMFTPGYVRTPGYPSGIQNVSRCSWVVSGPPSKRVLLTFKYADKSVIPDCSLTYIAVEAIIGYRRKSQTLCLKGERTVAIYEHSIISISPRGLEHINTGIEVEYVAEEEDRCYNTLRISNESVGEIMSPGFPTGYSDLQECRWFIFSNTSEKLYIQLKVLESDLDDTENCSKDIVEMYNPANYNIIGSWCGRTKPTFQFFLTTLMVVYRTGTEHSRNHTGFKLRYEIVEDGMCDQQLTASDIKQILKSDNYPNPFPSYKKCKYVITSSPRNAVYISVKASDVGGRIHCVDRVISVYDGLEETIQNRIGGFCLDKTPSYQSLSSQMLIVFEVDANIYNTGFLLEYWEGQVNVALEASGYDKSFVFPPVKGNYLSGYNTWWNITSSRPRHIVVWFTEVDVKCPEDSITLHDGGVGQGYRSWTFCGKDDRSFMTTTEQLFINFQTHTNLGKGFKLAYQSYYYRYCGASVSELTTDDSTSTIYSPAYSYQYFDQMNCRWLLTSSEDRIKLIINIVNISKSENCVQDFLAVYDGPSTKYNRLSIVCGSNITKTVRSTGKTLYIQFVSDGYSSAYGFSLVYSPASENIDLKDPSPDPLIIGLIVLFIIVGIAIILGFCYWLRRKNLKSKSTSAEENSMTVTSSHVVASNPTYANVTAPPSYTEATGNGLDQNKHGI
ncbi:cubilin-like isoform X2 [Haliotis asinina]|uniref:cubilin-like isoform X2 n=1 Tax=Haliotis asinina TaxID=109174 RepID=UPI003531D701